MSTNRYREYNFYPKRLRYLHLIVGVVGVAILIAAVFVQLQALAFLMAIIGSAFMIGAFVSHVLSLLHAKDTA